MRTIALAVAIALASSTSVLAQAGQHSITGFRADPIRVTETPGTPLRRERGQAVCDAAQGDRSGPVPSGAALACRIPIVLRTAEGLFLVRAAGSEVYIADSSVTHTILPNVPLPPCPPGQGPSTGSGQRGSMGAGTGMTCSLPPPRR